ncbi:MAG: conjugal transfer protein TrbE [Fervidicoccus sp.]|nr:MAG: conjugal transfer protein TrbE [Fervidicoccus sp.]
MGKGQHLLRPFISLGGEMWREGKRWKWYRLQGSSFTILPYEDRDLLLSDFASMLTSSKRGAILARKTQREFQYSSHIFQSFETEFFLAARADAQIFWFEAREVEEPSRPKVKKLLDPFTLKLEDGSLARVLVAYRFPSALPEGILYSLFSEVSEVALLFREIEHSKAVGLVENARKRRMDGERITEGFEAQSLGDLALRVLSGSSLFEFYVLFTLIGSDAKELRAKERRLKALLKGYGMDADAPPIQRDLYMLNPCSGIFCIEKHFSDGESLKPLFFLIDEELHDPNGVFLGMSGTGSPVLLDLWSKPNLNFVIVGITGSGKSMTAKVFLKRLREKDASIPIVGIDPESEYTEIASKFGAQAVEIKERESLGLDPLKLMREGAMEIGQVSDVLSEIYSIPDALQGVLRKELFMNGDYSEDIVEFASSVKDPTLSRYLQGIGAPPDSYVYQGSPPVLSKSVVFGLKNVRSKKLKLLISALISSYAYNKLLTRAQKSAFFVDEAWLFMETPSILSLFENIARRGRKHGTAFLYISQRAEDLARSKEGRTILEQAGTVFLMRQEPQGKDAVKEIYKLSDSEAEFLVGAPIGSGILKSWRKRITLQIATTEEELRAFSTSLGR